jgi:ribosomal protein S18 acetylase RimI-like enzyme
MEKVEVRKATLDDLSILVPLVARAFHPQPLTCWLLGKNDKALKRGQRLIELEFEKALPYHLTYTTHGLHGAALWHPPDKKLELRHDLIWSLNSAAAIGLSLRTISHIITGLRLALQEPKQSHYYLAILGVDPEAQGKGIGSALIQAGLAICDKDKRPAYLVTDTESAVRFYKRHGFRVRNEIPASGSALILWSMWRDPAGVNK